MLFYSMKRPLLIRSLTVAEQQQLEEGLHSSEAYTLRHDAARSCLQAAGASVSARLRKIWDASPKPYEILFGPSKLEV